jgi:PAS domain S-box-containing protein
VPSTHSEPEANDVASKTAGVDGRDLQEALRDEIAWRRLLVEQSRDGIVVVDQNGKVFEANKRFADMLGYSPEEVLDLFVWDWECLATKEQILGMAQAVDASGDHFETRHRRKDGTIIDVELSNNGAVHGGRKLIFCVCRDITERKQYEQERANLITELQTALEEIKSLRGIIPICSTCKRIRDDEGYWEQVDDYVAKHSMAHFSHSICPECMKKLYPQLSKGEED